MKEPIDQVIARALSEPEAEERLESIRGRVTVVVPDVTRPLAYPAVVRPLLDRIADRVEDLRLLVALGLHRPMTQTELMPLEVVALGADATLLQHDAEDPEQLVELSEDVGLFADRSGPPLPAAFHRAVVEADRVVLVGVVEPHQYAGFSGGAKTIGIGSAAKATISAMHGLSFLRDPKTRLGCIDQNPFQSALWRLVEGLPSVDALQVVPCDATHLHFAAFDAARRAHERAVQVARRELFEEHEAPCDWLHLPVLGPKATSFYQASRAATYAALVERPVIREGGVLVVEASCSEGNGRGQGEKAFERVMSRGVDALLGDLASDEVRPTTGGEQRAYVLARLLERFGLALVGAERPMPGLEAMGIRQFDTFEEARRTLGLEDRKGMTLRDVFARVPVLKGG